MLRRGVVLRGGGFGRLYSVVSPARVHRKAPHYVWFVVVPLFQMAPTAEAYYDCRGKPTTLLRTSATELDV